jgi:hypothetical protein
VTFGRPGEDGLRQRGQPDQPVRHRMLPGSGHQLTRPFGIKMFVMFIVIDTNYLMPKLSDGDSTWRSPKKKPPT